jgi:hypothetical protein
MNTPVQKLDKPSVNPSNSGSKQTEAFSKQAEARSQLNVSIVQTSLSVSISSQNEPLALLFKSAINSLNDVLRPEFGENIIQNAANQDNTPEGTADRIVSLSTGFFEAFKQQHSGENETDILQKFMGTIRNGFERGFSEASNILQGLKVLEGDIAANINKAHELVMQGYAAFEASHMPAA